MKSTVILGSALIAGMLSACSSVMTPEPNAEEIQAAVEADVEGRINKPLRVAMERGNWYQKRVAQLQFMDSVKTTKIGCKPEKDQTGTRCDFKISYREGGEPSERVTSARFVKSEKGWVVVVTN
jgi:hypothetical protein